MNTKKIIASLLAAVCTLSITASLMTSCTQGGAEQSTATTDATTTAPISEPAPDTAPPQADPDPWVSAIFGGGPFVTGLTGAGNNLKRLRSSGYNTVIVWSVHVHEDGTLVLNDVEAVRDGKITARSRYSENWGKIKGGDSTVTRVELSVGAWGCKDFESIGALMKRDGTGPDTILYKNFKTLIDAFDADAIDFDDETCYDPEILTQFGKMCGDMGVKVTLCPFNQMEVWKKVYKNLGSDLVDRIYVQCYSGGAGNWGSLASWKRAFGVDVIPGVFPTEQNLKPADVSTYLKQNQKNITGCFYWLYDDMSKLTGNRTFEEFGKAVMDVSKYDD